jgi:hypothetical protein
MPRGFYNKTGLPYKQGFKKGHGNIGGGVKKGQYLGEKHPNWKGDEIGYRALHKWVEFRLGKPRFCENCGNGNLTHREYHWANISGLYKRQLSDWRRLCVSCHSKFDFKEGKRVRNYKGQFI